MVPLKTILSIAIDCFYIPSACTKMNGFHLAGWTHNNKTIAHCDLPSGCSNECWNEQMIGAGDDDTSDMACACNCNAIIRYAIHHSHTIAIVRQRVFK